MFQGCSGCVPVLQTPQNKTFKIEKKKGQCVSIKMMLTKYDMTSF